MFIYLLLVILFLCLLISRWHARGFRKLTNQLRTDIRSFPILGHAYLAGNKVKIMSGLQRFGRDANKNGGITYMWTFNIFTVLITDPEIIDVVSKKCLEKHYIMEFLEPMLGNGSLIASERIWRHRRKITTQIFRQQILKKFVNNIFSPQGAVLAERLREVEGKGTFPLWNYVNTYNIDTVFEALLGVQLKAQYDPDQPFIKALNNCCNLISKRIFQPWLHCSLIYKLLPQYRKYQENAKVLKDFVDQNIKYKQKEMENKEQANKLGSNHRNYDTDNKKINHSDPNSFLELLLEFADGDQPITDLECREELMVLAIAATDTSALGLSYTAVMLSRHPDVQEKVYQEIREVFGESDRPLEAGDLPRLNYLQAVIKESLRLYPPVPAIIRTLEKDFSLPSGMNLPKGVGVVLLVWGMHRNPKYWGEDADVFRPERFLEAPLKHPAAYMSFSYGPRKCPGQKFAMMSITSSMAILLRNYQLLPATPAIENLPDIPDLKDQPLRLQYDIMMRDVDGFKIRIKSRV